MKNVLELALAPGWPPWRVLGIDRHAPRHRTVATDLLVPYIETVLTQQRNRIASTAATTARDQDAAFQRATLFQASMLGLH